MDKHSNEFPAAVHREMLRILREGIKDPTTFWRSGGSVGEVENAAGQMLKDAGLLNEQGRITLLGLSYYRHETANPFLGWLKAHWFAVVVAVATIAVSVWGIVT